MKPLLILLLVLPSLVWAQSAMTGIAQVRMSVRDLDRAVAFYAKTVGLQRTNKPVALNPSPSSRTALLAGPNTQLELIEYVGSDKQPPCPMPIPGPGITHVCYQSPDRISIYDRVKAAGGSVVSRGTSPVDRGFGIRYAYLRDPDGILFETEQLAKPTFADSLWVGHVAIVTPDIDRAVAFYQQWFGAPPINRIDNIKNSPKLNDIANIDDLRLRGAWFSVGKMLLEIWQFENPATPNTSATVPTTQIGYQSITFATKNLDADYQRLQQAGVLFLGPPNVAGTYCRDPDGNLIGLRGMK